MKILEEEKTLDCSVDALWSFLSFGQNAVGLDFLRVAFDCSVDALWSFLSFGQNAVGLDFLRVAKKTNW